MVKEKISATVFALTRNHLPTGEGCPESVISLLNNLADKASRGEIVGLSAAWVEGNNDCVHQIAIGCADAAKMVASVSALNWDITARWLDK